MPGQDPASSSARFSNDECFRGSSLNSIDSHAVDKEIGAGHAFSEARVTVSKAVFIICFDVLEIQS